MKIWVETRLITPPVFTVSGRFGASVMFVGYSKITDQWLWLQPNGVAERIGEPPMIYVEQDYASRHRLKVPRARRDQAQHIHEKRVAQLTLDL